MFDVLLQYKVVLYNCVILANNPKRGANESYYFEGVCINENFYTSNKIIINLPSKTSSSFPIEIRKMR